MKIETDEMIQELDSEVSFDRHNIWTKRSNTEYVARLSSYGSKAVELIFDVLDSGLVRVSIRVLTPFGMYSGDISKIPIGYFDKKINLYTYLSNVIGSILIYGKAPGNNHYKYWKSVAKGDELEFYNKVDEDLKKLKLKSSNFSERLRKCFSFIYQVRLTDRNDKSKSISIDNLEAGTWQEAVDKVIADHPEFGLKPGDYEGSSEVEVHWNYGGNTLKSF